MGLLFGEGGFGDRPVPSILSRPDPGRSLVGLGTGTTGFSGLVGLSVMGGLSAGTGFHETIGFSPLGGFPAMGGLSGGRSGLVTVPFVESELASLSFLVNSGLL